MIKKLKTGKHEFEFKKGKEGNYLIKARDLLRFIGYSNNTIIYRKADERDRLTDGYLYLNGQAIQDILDNSTIVRDDQRQFISQYIKPELNETDNYRLNLKYNRLMDEKRKLSKKMSEIDNKLNQLNEVKEWI